MLALSDDEAGPWSNNYRVWRHILGHYGQRPDEAARAYGDWTEDAGTHADCDAVLNDGVSSLRTIAVVAPPARRAERDLVVEHDLITHTRGLANYDTRAVVNEEPLPDYGAWVDFDAACYEPSKLAYRARYDWHAMRKEPVG